MDCRWAKLVGGTTGGAGWGTRGGGGPEVPEEIGIWINLLVCRWGKRKAGGDVCGHSGVWGLTLEGLRLCVAREN